MSEKAFRLTARAILSGHRVDKDLLKARTYAEDANSYGDPLGESVLGAMLRDGIAGPPDVACGFALLQRASTSNIGYASFQLGIAYARGRGTPADKDKAAEAYRKALKLGTTSARARLTALGFTE